MESVRHLCCKSFLSLSFCVLVSGCKHVELKQFWHAFASRGFLSVSWAFLSYHSHMCSTVDRQTDRLTDVVIARGGDLTKWVGMIIMVCPNLRENRLKCRRRKLIPTTTPHPTLILSRYV